MLSFYRLALIINVLTACRGNAVSERLEGVIRASVQDEKPSNKTAFFRYAKTVGLGKQNAHTPVLSSAQPSLEPALLCVLWIATVCF